MTKHQSAVYRSASCPGNPATCGSGTLSDAPGRPKGPTSHPASAIPRWRMFRAALTSRSVTRPQPPQANSRTPSGMSCLCPQAWQSVLVCLGSTRTTDPPALSASYDRRIRNEQGRWLWISWRRIPVEKPSLAFSRFPGSFLCRDRRRLAWRRRCGARPRRAGRTVSALDRISGSVCKHGRPAFPSASRVLDGCWGSRTESSRG